MANFNNYNQSSTFDHYQQDNQSFIQSGLGEDQSFFNYHTFDSVTEPNQHTFLELNYQNNNNSNKKDFQDYFTQHRNSISQFTATSGRSPSSDLNSIFSELAYQQLQLQLGNSNNTNPIMDHRRTISIASQQSAIETSNSQDLNQNLVNKNDRKISIAESDRNISPVLLSDPFEMDQSLWSAAVVTSSTPINLNDDNNNFPTYRYRAEVSHNTSPTFNAGHERQGSSQFNEMSLNAIPQQQQQQGNTNDRRASFMSDSIWSTDQYQQHSRHSSFNMNEPVSATANPFVRSNESSPVVAQFAANGKQQLLQLQPFRPMMVNPSTIEDLSTAAAQRRHSYAAVGDNQWLNEGFNGMISDGGYFNLSLQQSLQKQQQQPLLPPYARYTHNQRLSFDLGNYGQNTRLNFAIDDNENKQPHESSETLKAAYAAVDYYFTNDEFNRVHITDTSSEDLTAALDALSKKGLQLPRFPGNSLPGAKLVLIAFKAGRIDVFYLPENSTMILRFGDLVYVEADRGQDLGKVVKLDVSIDEARLLKLRQHQEQQLALVDNEQITLTSPSSPAQQQTPSLHFPKPVIRFADPQQVSQVPNKQADEEKARRVCSLKVRTHGLIMQVVDLEYQWDRRKLTFYYAANQRIDFRELVKELFRIYKTRIWMCAVSGGLTATQQQSIIDDYNSTQQFNSTLVANLFNGPYNEYVNRQQSINKMDENIQ